MKRFAFWKQSRELNDYILSEKDNEASTCMARCKLWAEHMSCALHHQQWTQSVTSAASCALQLRVALMKLSRLSFTIIQSPLLWVQPQRGGARYVTAALWGQRVLPQNKVWSGTTGHTKRGSICGALCPEDFSSLMSTFPWSAVKNKPGVIPRVSNSAALCILLSFKYNSN